MAAVLQDVGAIDRRTRREIVSRELTRESLRERLRYDPSTGIFTWVSRVANCVRGGEMAGCIDCYGYRVVSIRDVPFKAHKLAWLYMTGEWPKHQIDHINGEKADNRWKNLREAPGSTNRENLRSADHRNSTGLLGVSRSRTGFRAHIGTKGKRLKLGTYKTAEQAHEAYLRAKRVLHKGGTL